MNLNDQQLGWTVGYAEEQLKATRLAERERIIKLLEPLSGCRDEACGNYCDCLRAEWVIALLKGENE